MELEEAKGICRELIDKVASKAEAWRQSAPERANKEFTSWTAAVKSVLEKIASREQYRYESLYSNREKDIHEFLVDFTWWDPRNKTTVLVCECEFGNVRDIKGNPGRVGEDFDKLLSVKAMFKLMIFDSYEAKTSDSQVKNILDTLQQHLREFGQHFDGEIYILLDTRDLNDLNRARLWQCVIKQNGPDPSLVLSEISAF